MISGQAIHFKRGLMDACRGVMISLPLVKNAFDTLED